MAMKRVWQAALALVVVAAIGGGATASAALLRGQQVSVCAEFTDAVGLYPGNAVTMLGIPVGSVTSVEPQGDRVRVRMRLDGDLPLPANVGAALVSQSIVTNRNIEFTKPYESGPKFSPAQGCIPLERTKTPVGVSKAFDAVGQLAGELLGGKGSGDDLLGQTVDAADTALAGTGPQFNAMLRRLAALTADSTTQDAQMRSLIDNLDALTGAFVTNWPDMKTLLDNLLPALRALDGMASNLAGTIDQVADVLPVAVRNIKKYDQQIYGTLDALSPLVRDQVTPRLGNILQLLGMLPSATAGLVAVVNPSVSAVRLEYQPPQLRSETGRPVGSISDLLGQVMPR